MPPFRLGGLPVLEPPDYDVVVVGGGPAGLAAALVLARSRRTVLVVDTGEPRNGSAQHVHGYLGLDGVPPADLARRARAEVVAYGARVAEDRAERLLPGADRITVELTAAAPVRGRRVVVATGLRDELPDVPGLAARWGRDVLHCPYCHGFETRDRAVVVLGSGTDAAHRAFTMAQWTDQVTLVAHGPDGGGPADDALPLDALPLDALRAVGVTVAPGPATGLAVTDDRLVGVRTPGGVVGCDAVLVQPRVVAHDGLLVAAGAEVRAGPFGQVVLTGDGGVTAVPGVWATGNVCEPQATVPTAAAAGYRTGVAVDQDLVAEDVRLATERGPRPARH